MGEESSTLDGDPRKRTKEIDEATAVKAAVFSDSESDDDDEEENMPIAQKLATQRKKPAPKKAKKVVVVEEDRAVEEAVEEDAVEEEDELAFEGDEEDSDDENDDDEDKEKAPAPKRQRTKKSSASSSLSAAAAQNEEDSIEVVVQVDSNVYDEETPDPSFKDTESMENVEMYRESTKGVEGAPWSVTMHHPNFNKYVRVQLIKHKNSSKMWLLIREGVVNSSNPKVTISSIPKRRGVSKFVDVYHTRTGLEWSAAIPDNQEAAIVTNKYIRAVGSERVTELVRKPDVKKKTKRKRNITPSKSSSSTSSSSFSSSSSSSSLSASKKRLRGGMPVNIQNEHAYGSSGGPSSGQMHVGTAAYHRNPVGKNYIFPQKEGLIISFTNATAGKANVAETAGENDESQEKKIRVSVRFGKGRKGKLFVAVVVVFFFCGGGGGGGGGGALSSFFVPHVL